MLRRIEALELAVHGAPVRHASLLERLSRLEEGVGVQQTGALTERLSGLENFIGLFSALEEDAELQAISEVDLQPALNGHGPEWRHAGRNDMDGGTGYSHEPIAPNQNAPGPRSQKPRPSSTDMVDYAKGGTPSPTKSRADFPRPKKTLDQEAFDGRLHRWHACPA